MFRLIHLSFWWIIGIKYFAFQSYSRHDYKRNILSFHFTTISLKKQKQQLVHFCQGSFLKLNYKKNSSIRVQNLSIKTIIKVQNTIYTDAKIYPKYIQMTQLYTVGNIYTSYPKYSKTYLGYLEVMTNNIYHVMKTIFQCILSGCV